MGEVLALPGMIAGIAGISAYEIFKNSQVSLLVKGQAPGVSELGVIIGTVGAGIPVVIYSMLPGLAGAIIAFLAALIIGGLALSVALKAYRMIQ